MTSVRVVLDSSVLKQASYASDETLDLEFRTGAVYRYFGVPCAVFENLILAPSKGACFNRNIRDNFCHQRLA
jgi:hypothetical protein